MTVYVLVRYSGEYSDYSESIRGVFTDLASAKQLGVAALREFRKPVADDWTYEEKWKQYELTDGTRYSKAGCYIHVMELNEVRA